MKCEAWIVKMTILMALYVQSSSKAPEPSDFPLLLWWLQLNTTLAIKGKWVPAAEEAPRRWSFCERGCCSHHYGQLEGFESVLPDFLLLGNCAPNSFSKRSQKCQKIHFVGAGGGGETNAPIRTAAYGLVKRTSCFPLADRKYGVIMIIFLAPQNCNFWALPTM